MIAFLLLSFIVAVKVFKKTTPNGKVTVYLGKRDFIDHLDHIEPIDGVVVVDNDYLKGRKIYGQLTTTYRYGREEDEVMGLKFSKDMILAKDQIVPSLEKKPDLTPVQEKLVKKFGANAFPFTYHFPNHAPCSVTLQTGDSTVSKPLGVEYFVKCYVGNNEEDLGHKRSSVALAVKKLQYAPSSKSRRLPSALVSKGFTFGNGKISLEVTLDKDLYYHGERISVDIGISNNSNKSVKNIKCYVVQHVEVTMVNAQFSKYVASLETKEGCPITPSASFTKKFFLVPLASSNRDRYGIALDGYLKDEDVNLASSTLVSEGSHVSEALGIVVSYSVRVKINCGTLGGELVTDVPFKLMHPQPGSLDEEKVKTLRKVKSIERSQYENSRYVEGEEDIVFEDFARLRMEDQD
ncbi:UNVERIFIED_CONTAM: hypothetical protein PYX00_008924 [Menopon gallinae]|uniref:Arrestin C-terminal-like domain-containing protein n=1 Tax=Menopon gallinae TaxID=328185 RepID=A0AAW2H954_9NEOP